MTPVQIPSDFIEKASQLYGHKADEWLRTLPERLAQCVARFGITIGSPYPNLSYNLIYQATASGGIPAVLKLGPLVDEIMHEANVLRGFEYGGGVKVLDAEESVGAILLERIDPGTPLADTRDDAEATRIFCAVMRQLHGGERASDTDLLQATPLHVHLAAIERYAAQQMNAVSDSPLQADWVSRARSLLAELIATTHQPVLLHGDLHHGNILQRDTRDWAVIDPKGLIGDIHFEPIQYLLNYVDRDGPADEVLRRRISIMADALGLDPARIAQWGVVRGVVEACWTLEDGGDDWPEGIAISERFSQLL